MINNKNQLKDYNILCENLEQVKECFNKLEEMGFIIGCRNKDKKALCIFFDGEFQFFSHSTRIHENKSISFKNFKKAIKRLKWLEGSKKRLKESKKDFDKAIEKHLEKEDDIYEFRSDLLDIDISNTSPNKSKVLRNESEYTIYITSDDCSLVHINGQKHTTHYHYFLIKLIAFQQRGEFDKKPDIEVAEDGRVVKINNWKSGQEVFRIGKFPYSIGYNTIKSYGDCGRKPLQDSLNASILYNTAEARDKAVQKMQVETQLKNLAEELNGGEVIDWFDIEHYHIYYDHFMEELRQGKNEQYQVQGAIYCLSPKFLEVAIKRIGKENLLTLFK